MKTKLTLMVGIFLLAGCGLTNEQEPSLTEDLDETSEEPAGSPDAARGEAANPYCATSEKGDICLPTRAAEETYRLLVDRKWHPRAGRVASIFYREADGETFHVIMGPEDSDVAEALQRVAGNRVNIESQAISRFSGSRSADISPHWGGAAVTFAGNTCSAGFTVNLNGGGRGSVTAGHCFENGDTLVSGPADLAHIYGLTEGKDNFPLYDMMLITDDDGGIPGITYTNKIYTDPGSPSARNVVGSASVDVGASVCVSGRLTKAKCNAVVADLFGTLTQTDGGITTGLIVAKKAGVVLAQKGDSGAPIYTPSGASNAVINGMLVGGADNGTTIVAEKISWIQSHLGVTVATTP